MATRKPGVGPQLRTIEDAQERVGLSDAELAGALGADAAALQRWRAGDPMPVSAARGVEEIRSFVTELDRTFAAPADARAWLDHPVPALGLRTPRELIRAGETGRITGMLYALNAGIPT